MFQPSSNNIVAHFYGDAEEAAQSTSPYAIDPALVETATALAAGLTGGDAREKLARKRGQLANTKALYHSASTNFMKNIYAARIRKLQSEISALESIAQEARAGVVSYEAGKYAIVFATAAGGVTLLMIANYFRQKAKSERSRRGQQ